jgi:hypothetical protein
VRNDFHGPSQLPALITASQVAEPRHNVGQGLAMKHFLKILLMLVVERKKF